LKPDLTDTDLRTIQEGVRRKYAQVAATGGGSCFRYPTGREGMRLQGYPLDLAPDFPEAVLQSFCGVGNPFSLGPIHPGDAVLDIGCGAGVDTLLAARMAGPAGRAVGIDAVPEMIALARTNLALTGLANVSFEIGTAEALPFPDREFDVVLSNGVFNLTTDKEQALREVHRVLKRGGRLMLADMVLVEDLPPGQAGKVENWFQ
jgi:SAM-dependent methyltransferase